MTTVSNSDSAQVPTPKGLKAGALGLVSSVVIGVASTAPAYSLAATLGFIVAFVGLQSPAVVVLAFVPMLFIVDRLPAAQQGRPGLRHHLHLGDPGVRPEGRLDGRLGHRRRRRAGDGQPGPGCRPVRVPAVQRRRHRRRRRPAAGCCWSGVLWIAADDLHLLRRHRAVGRASSRCCWRSRSSCCSSSRSSRWSRSTATAPPDAVDPPGLSWFNPFAHRLDLRLRRAASLLMLFIYWGWDTRGLGERGDQGPEQDARPRRGHLDRAAAGHLRAGDGGRAGVRRRRRHGHRAGQLRQLRRRAVACSARRCSAAAGSARSCRNC